MNKFSAANMINAGIARRITPTWKDKEGNTCEEKDAYGCMVDVDITDPNMCIVFDEVGGNTSQKGDGHKGEAKYVCEIGSIPQQKMSEKDKKFTVLGLTCLDGKPLMCVIIIKGKKENKLNKVGIDIFKLSELDKARINEAKARKDTTGCGSS